MQPSSESPTPPTCPPHRWLIEGTARDQQWACQQCGAERKHEDTSQNYRSGTWHLLPARPRQPPDGQ